MYRLPSPTIQFGGRFCTGNYSHIWNIGRRATATDWPNKYDGTSTGDARLVKVKDSGAYCSIDRVESL